MFGVEPDEPWSEEEKQDYEAYASAQTKSYAIRALKVAVALAVNIACIVPFSAGHRLNSHWHIAQFLGLDCNSIVPLAGHEDWFCVVFLASYARDTTRI